jgi:hypothetical protein
MTIKSLHPAVLPLRASHVQPRSRRPRSPGPRTPVAAPDTSSTPSTGAFALRRLTSVGWVQMDSLGSSAFVVVTIRTRCSLALRRLGVGDAGPRWRDTGSLAGIGHVGGAAPQHVDEGTADDGQVRPECGALVSWPERMRLWMFRHDFVEFSTDAGRRERTVASAPSASMVNAVAAGNAGRGIGTSVDLVRTSGLLYGLVMKNQRRCPGAQG